MSQLDSILRSVAFNPDGTFADIESAKRLLEFMVSHDTGSHHAAKFCKTNVPFVKALKESLETLGLETRYAEDEYPLGSGIKHATLVARMGPETKGGIVLSSHTDVIPVTEDDRKHWVTSEPFVLSETTHGLTARGAVDMKQAIVNYMAIAQMYQGKHQLLKEPVYIALSWGEEIGCKGVPTVNKLLGEMNADPRLIVVGEPTNEDLIIAHKGAANVEINIKAAGGHSGDPERWISAGKYATNLQHKLIELQKKYKKQQQYQDPAFEPPFPVVNIGTVSIGSSNNTVPSNATIGVHIRSTSKVSLNEIMSDIERIIYDENRHLENASRDRAKRLNVPVTDVGITYKQLSESKALPLQQDETMLSTIRGALTEIGKPDAQTKTVGYAADAGGLYSRFPSSTTVIFGTGDLSQGAHVANEFITREQLARGPAFPLKMISEICLDRRQSNLPGTWMIPMSASRTVSTTPPQRQTP